MRGKNLVVGAIVAMVASLLPSHVLANQPTIATGHIQVTSFGVVETHPDGTSGNVVADLHVTETFTGDLEAEGVVDFRQVLFPDGTAQFTGEEHITGTLAQRSGSFDFRDSGTVDGSIVSGNWRILNGSDGFAALHGEGTFLAQLGVGATYRINYHFDA